METVEVVIKIPKKTYNNVKKTECIIWGDDAYYIGHAIANGTVLPEGHGRIADIDKVLEEMRATRTYDIPFTLERVKPIIEADKDGE